VTPPTKRLVLLRHGLTAWNAEPRFQGQADVELTEVGHQQAKLAAVALTGLEPVLLWSSDLTRAATTAAYVAETTGLEPVSDPRLREAHVGVFQGRRYAEVIEEYGPGPWDYGEYGGEPDAEIGRRIADAVADLAAALPAGGTGIAVSHGHAIKIGIATVLGWPESAAVRIAGMDNCAWAELEIGSDGEPRLVAYNRLAPIS